MASLADDLYQLKSQFDRDNLLFCYSGFFTQEVLEGIGVALRAKLAVEQTERRVAKNLFSVFVEQVQNVVRYSAEKDEGDSEQGGETVLRYGILLVGRRAGGYFVSCGNLVRDEDVERLRGELAIIETLSREELMIQYKQALRRPPPPGCKGANVGFLDIARLAGGGVEFDFTQVREGYSFFAMNALM
ncbi:SiaB family protein kinase [Pararhodospirillum oryzae]|uniref:Uncharacterized protein n=1 Tax=Pararhodospirillum oryzae TaxID=478448 RepID=A0A512H8Q4_9PROT|nr:SiaB family protein kinase [Pararhodospirillum oryzae]GEO81837.1 hypothetical protein ROR02_19680 [Pararhodospirillum oryzae]